MLAEVLKMDQKCRKCESTDIALCSLKKKDYICRACKKETNRRRYLENRDAYIEQAAGRYSEANKAYGTKHWANVTRAGLKYYDKKKNKYPVSNLTNEDLLEFTKMSCFYCNDSTDRIGVDRIDNDIGHVKENLVPSCYSCNSTRMENWSHDEMKLIGKAIAEIKARRRRT